MDAKDNFCFLPLRTLPLDLNETDEHYDDIDGLSPLFNMDDLKTVSQELNASQASSIDAVWHNEFGDLQNLLVEYNDSQPAIMSGYNVMVGAGTLTEGTQAGGNVVLPYEQNDEAEDDTEELESYLGEASDLFDIVEETIMKNSQSNLDFVVPQASTSAAESALALTSHEIETEETATTSGSLTNSAAIPFVETTKKRSYKRRGRGRPKKTKSKAQATVPATGSKSKKPKMYENPNDPKNFNAFKAKMNRIKQKDKWAKLEQEKEMWKSKYLELYNSISQSNGKNQTTRGAKANTKNKTKY